jgi:hypothetical protein
MKIFGALVSGAVLLMAAVVAPAADKGEAEDGCGSLQKLTYFDSKVFDAGMDQVIRRGCGTVDIDMLTEVRLDKLPPRIDGWLERIVASGGGMTVVEEVAAPKEELKVSGARGLAVAGAVTDIGSAAVAAFGYLKKLNQARLEKNLGKAAGEYTVVLYVNRKDGVLKAMRLVKGNPEDQEAVAEVEDIGG